MRRLAAKKALYNYISYPSEYKVSSLAPNGASSPAPARRMLKCPMNILSRLLGPFRLCFWWSVGCDFSSILVTMCHVRGLMTRRFTLLCIRGKFWHSACYPWLWTRVYCGSLCICLRVPAYWCRIESGLICRSRSPYVAELPWCRAVTAVNTCV